jgi:hypothetical protein
VVQEVNRLFWKILIALWLTLQDEAARITGW